jgi:hypothetical protein
MSRTPVRSISAILPYVTDDTGNVTHSRTKHLGDSSLACASQGLRPQNDICTVMQQVRSVLYYHPDVRKDQVRSISKIPPCVTNDICTVMLRDEASHCHAAGTKHPLEIPPCVGMTNTLSCSKYEASRGIRTKRHQ